MMTKRNGQTLVIDRVLPKVGRLNRRSGTHSRLVLEAINAKIDDLIATLDFATLARIKDGSIHPLQLIEKESPPASEWGRRRHQYVYVVLRPDTNEVKIGITCHLNKRLRILQSGSARRLEVVAIIKGGRTREMEAHRQFARFHIRGEWFVAAPEVLGWAKRYDVRELAPKNEVPDFGPDHPTFAEGSSDA